MRYFGTPGDAPIYDDTTPVPTPVGEPCMFPECEFPIIDGERGFVLMDMATGQEVPIHRRCLLLWVVPAAVDSIGEDPNDGPVG